MRNRENRENVGWVIRLQGSPGDNNEISLIIILD